MNILNLTQHEATIEQIKAGVIEPAAKEEVVKLLTFEELPTSGEILSRAEKLASLAEESGCRRVMIGGAPFLMSKLEAALKGKGLVPMYAFSKRVVKEFHNGQTVCKHAVFVHLGFVEA